MEPAAASWILRRELLGRVLPQSYWTIVEHYEDGKWCAHTPGLHFSGFQRADHMGRAIEEAAVRIAFTIRYLYEVHHRLPCSLPSTLEAAQQLDAKDREAVADVEEMLARRERQEEGLELRRRDTAAAFARFGSPGASDPAGEAPRRGDRPHRPIGSVGASDVPEDAPRRGERPPHPPYPRGLQVVEQQWVRVAVNLSLADAADLRAHPSEQQLTDPLPPSAGTASAAVEAALAAGRHDLPRRGVPARMYHQLFGAPPGTEREVEPYPSFRRTLLAEEDDGESDEDGDEDMGGDDGGGAGGYDALERAHLEREEAAAARHRYVTDDEEEEEAREQELADAELAAAGWSHVAAADEGGGRPVFTAAGQPMTRGSAAAGAGQTGSQAGARAARPIMPYQGRDAILARLALQRPSAYNTPEVLERARLTVRLADTVAEQQRVAALTWQQGAASLC